MLHEKSLMEHNARTLDESTRNFLKTEGPVIAVKHMPNVVVKHNTELEVTEDLQQHMSDPDPKTPLSPNSPTKSYIANEKAIYAGLEDSDASEEDGYNMFLSNHLMGA